MGSTSSASSGGTRAADGFRRKIPRGMLDSSQPADCAGSTHADRDILIANQETHAKFSWLKDNYGTHSGPMCARTGNPLTLGLMEKSLCQNQVTLRRKSFAEMEG